MRFLELLAGASAVASAVAAPAPDAPTPTVKGSRAAKGEKRASKFDFVGINESGAEFGNTNLPGRLGKDYTWPVHSAIDTMIDQGFNTFRIPIMMERLVPTKLDGTVNATYEEGLTDILKYITGKDAYAILDPHNFGRYYDKIVTDVDGFKAWWTTAAGLYKDLDKVIFDTNNEYHDMDNDLVTKLNQAAIDGIRAAGANTQYIFVEGNSWTGAWTWTTSGNSDLMKSFTDPADDKGSKIVYEMHQYLDEDGSGTHEECVSGTIGQERLKAATEWLKANGKRGVLGETAGGANDQCITALTGMLSYMQDNKDVWGGWLWWGGGPWWGDYMYGIEPPSGVAFTKVLPSLKPYV